MAIPPPLMELGRVNLEAIVCHRCGEGYVMTPDWSGCPSCTSKGPGEPSPENYTFDFDLYARLSERAAADPRGVYGGYFNV